MSYSPFKIEKSTDGGLNWSEVADIPQGTFTASISGIIDSQETKFRARAYYGAVYSGYSDIETQTCQWIPMAPTNLTLSCGI